MAQLERSNQAPLPLPLVAAALGGISQVSGRLVKLWTGQKEHVLGTLERAGCMLCLTQSQDGPPHERPTKREPACLLFADDRIPLRHLEQTVEAGAQRRSIRQCSTACRLGGLAFGNKSCSALGCRRLSILLTERREVPIDALDGVWRCPEGDSWQAAQQDLDVSAT